LVIFEIVSCIYAQARLHSNLTMLLA
jgi:hypothetical protein